MKVAVTGASGFLGQHVLSALAATDAEVVAVVRPGSEFSISARDNLQVATVDFATASDPLETIGHPDTLIHLAWGGLPNYRSEHHLTHELPQQLQFLSNCIRSGLNHLVVAGTCLEYGMQTGELNEDLPTKPTTEYGRAKDALRLELETLLELHEFGMAWTRLFYLYGPGQAATSLYSQLHAAAVRCEPCFPMSPGAQIRDFMPAAEAGRCIAALALRCANDGVVNVCSGVPITVREMAQGWLDEWGSTMRLDLGRLPYPDYEPHAFWGNRGKLNHLIGGENAAAN